MSMRKVVSVEQAEWSIAPPSDWVESREPEWSFAVDDGSPVAFLLYDQQHHVASRVVSTRSVRRLLTPNAVQSLAQVEIDFDPAADRLVIHEVAVWRPVDGRWEKRSHARRETFLLRQREQQLERQILNGRVSLVALLEDVRVGDAIDLWWTIEPREQLPGLHFTTFFSFSWPFPVARGYFTLHLAPEHPVTWRMNAPEGAPLPTSEQSPQRASWKIENPPRRVAEPNAPPGDWPFAWLDVSGWKSWGEVARFVADSWSEALAHGADAVREEAMRLGAVPDIERAARDAIRFVQEEIRYLALDFGQGGGILPDGAGNVLRRRFGDCKDKSILLTALLRALRIDACPLLVAPNWRDALAKLQPSISAFSHAIVTFTLGGKRYFVDPTEVGQGGDLARLVGPPLVYGLEIVPQTEALLPLPELPPAELTLTETFQLDRRGRTGSCEQVLSASAWLANHVREALVRGGTAAFHKARTEALQRHFPALTPSAEAPSVRDDVDANAIEFSAKYSLPTWGRSGEKPPAKFRYGAHGLFLAVEDLHEAEVRTQPWVLRFPMKVLHRVIVRGKCVAKTAAETHRVDGTGFRYECLVRGKRHEVAFEYRWETTQQLISPSDWSDYRRDRSRAFEQAGANVTTTGGSMPGLAAPSFRWWMIPLVIALLRGAALVGERARAPETRSPTEQLAREGSQPQRLVDLRPALEAVRRGDHAAALPIVQEAEPIYSNRFDYQTLRAEVMIYTGRLELARRAIASARSLNGTSEVPDWLEGLLLETEGDLAAARTSFERARNRAPDSIGVLGNLARVNEELGDEPAALSLWQAVLEKSPAQPDALLHYAFLLWQRGDRERADAAFVGAVRSQPTASAELQAALAQYYGWTGRPVEGIDPARRASELAPDEPKMASIYVMALARAGRIEAAVEEGERATRRFPEDAATWGGLAIAAAQARQVDVAERAFQSWLKIAPNDPDAPTSYGYFLHQSGQSARARGVLEEATRRFPGYGPAWRNYAVVLAALGDTSGAQRAREKATALMSDQQDRALVR